jgi:GxxExxY protein
MGYGEGMPARVEAIGKNVVDAAFKVHCKFGPGLLESSYRVCLAHELRKRGHEVETEVVLPIVYDGVRLDAGYRIDILVDRLVVVETKAVEKLHPIFEAQTLTYLKLSGLPLAFLINFNVILFKDGIRRLVLKSNSTHRETESNSD